MTDAYKMQVGCGCLYILIAAAAFLTFWGVILHFVFKFW